MRANAFLIVEYFLKEALSRRTPWNVCAVWYSASLGNIEIRLYISLAGKMGRVSFVIIAHHMP